MSDVAQRVEELAMQAAKTEDCEVVEVIYRREGGGYVVRVAADKLPDDQGQERRISLDECGRISRQISSLLDVHDVIPNAYNLEVSSPGIERPLNKEGDFTRFAGKLVEVKTFQPMETEQGSRKRFRGTLVGLQEGMVVVTEADGEVSIPWEQVAKANLTFDF
ncbi:ribosome maturation factor RimP [Magnetococcus sp. PR-3]|uniref:ribosome maturation factor RimP n=1 Tax=Magnetococcus sp. PR-3 TaxID=3120355 RepID=UPI002FCE087D